MGAPGLDFAINHFGCPILFGFFEKGGIPQASTVGAPGLDSETWESTKLGYNLRLKEHNHAVGDLAWRVVNPSINAVILSE